MIEEGKDLPFSLEGQIIYYVGPAPNRDMPVVLQVLLPVTVWTLIQQLYWKKGLKDDW